MELRLADQSRAEQSQASERVSERTGCAIVTFDLWFELDVFVNEIYMRERMWRAKCHGATGNSALERKQTPWPMRSGHDGRDGMARHGTTSRRWFGGGVSRCFWLTPSVCSTLISSAMVAMVATAVIDCHHCMIYDLFSLLMF